LIDTFSPFFLEFQFIKCNFDLKPLLLPYLPIDEGRSLTFVDPRK